MDFKNTRFGVLLRVGFLILTIFLFIDSLYGNSIFITQLIFFILLGVQVIYLIKFIERTNRDIFEFLDSIEFNDLSAGYSTESKGGNMAKLYSEFNKVLRKLNRERKEKEDEFQYMRNIVYHVGIGLITFNSSGKVQIINTAAKRLLKMNSLKKIQDLKKLNPALVDMFFRLKTGGRDLIRLEIGGDIVQLAVYAIQLTLRGEEFKLVSLQNIQTELEEKEMEAWQNLVRVLTHEIMNSITPITSLATTIEGELDSTEKSRGKVHISESELEDIQLAIQTIKRRSAGLVRFVKDFRSLTHVSTPKITEINLSELFREIHVLLKEEIKENHIDFNIVFSNKDMVLNGDKEMISQVLINLIKNAIQAFNNEKEDECKVTLEAYYGEKAKLVISVRDNGPGIEEEAVEKIFIPFFTTKKSGSGIGLSLSRQIMRMHKGTIAVKSKIDKGTEFILKF